MQTHLNLQLTLPPIPDIVDLFSRFDSIAISLHTANGLVVTRFRLESIASIEHALIHAAQYVLEGKPITVKFE